MHIFAFPKESPTACVELQRTLSSSAHENGTRPVISQSPDKHKSSLFLAPAPYWVRGLIHWIQRHLRSPVSHPLRSASWGPRQKRNRFMAVMVVAAVAECVGNHYNLSGGVRTVAGGRGDTCSSCGDGGGWRPWVYHIIHSQWLHHAADTELTMSNILFIKVAPKNLVECNRLMWL